MNTKVNYRKTNRKVKKVPDKPISAKKLRVLAGFGIVIFLLLILRLFWIQFVNGASLKEKASRQQTSSTIISPKRGTIMI